MGMRITAVVLAAAIVGCTSPPPPSSDALPELAGLTAGKPERCISRRETNGLYIAGPHTIAVRDGTTLWINDVPGCVMRKSSDDQSEEEESGAPNHRRASSSITLSVSAKASMFAEAASSCLRVSANAAR